MDGVTEQEDFGALTHGRGEPCLIPDTAERGISLKQLLDVLRFLRCRCAPDGTIDGWRTAADDAGGADQPVKIQTTSLYHISRLLIRPATLRLRCSYVELVAQAVEAQLPEWFVSHWWGEPHAFFVACLQCFSRLRPGRAVFWICAYANNQHDLASEVTADPAQSSFRQAMNLSRGTVMVLDSFATSFWRVWCTYETAVTLREPDKVFDVVTFVPEYSEALPSVGDTDLELRGSFDMISDGLLPVDEQLSKRDLGLGRTSATKKADRERSFPLELMKRGLNIAVQHAKASMDLDRVHILNSIVGREDLELEPLVDHPAYDSVNSTLRSRFAMALLSYAVGKEKIPMELFNLALRTRVRDREQTRLAFDFPVSRELTNEMVANILTDLPPPLQDLSLSLQRCSQVGDGAIQALAKQLPGLSELRRLRTHFWQCEVSDDGLAAFGKSLAQVRDLTSLRMDLSFCRLVGDVGVKGLARGVASLSRLVELFLNVSNCEWVTDVALQALGDRLAALPALKELGLYFAGCTWITDTGVQAIGRCLGKLSTLERLSLNLVGCGVGPRGFRELTSGLARLSGLREMALTFDSKLVLRGDGAGQDGMEPLGRSLSALQNLEQLSMLFQGVRWVVDADAVALQAPLGQLAKLKKLTLSLQGVKIGSTGTSSLATMLRQCSNHGALRELSLMFDSQGHVTEASVEELVRSVVQLTGLTQLRLDLPGRAVCASAVNVFAQGLEAFTELLDLWISLKNAAMIDDAGLAPLAASAAKLNSLSELVVDLRGTAVTAECLDALCGELCAPTHWADLSAELRLQFSAAQRASMDARSPKAARESSSNLKGGRKGGKAKGRGRHGDESDSFKQIDRRRRDSLRAQLEEFAADTSLQSMSFGPGELTGNERRFVHHVASEIEGLVTSSFGEGDQRSLSVFRDTTTSTPKRPEPAETGNARGRGRHSRRGRGQKYPEP
mmetsp:Transcript_46304/g.128844  ORF Transcript_46304/g.128844 Transcript_46304/m.128844 type:complete len:958 (+) Transcript_46304:87-2960(+)